jgi:hypothetical protein
MPVEAGIQVLHVDSHLVLNIIPALAGILLRGIATPGEQSVGWAEKQRSLYIF